MCPANVKHRSKGKGICVVGAAAIVELVYIETDTILVPRTEHAVFTMAWLAIYYDSTEGYFGGLINAG